MSDALRSILERTPGAAMTELVRVGWFGLDGPTADETTLSLAETWSQAGPPLLVIAGWTALAVVLAKRSMQWEPRA
jgi:ABC-2 type transport system permease protein